MKKMFANKTEWRRDYYLRNKDKVQADVNKWRTANPEKFKEANWKAQLKRHYAMTPEDFSARVKAQVGRCAICETELVDPVVDHDHLTGEVRGLLCKKCNNGLGLLGDTSEMLQRAQDYLTADRNIIS